jgi:hypothetical protein
VTGFYVSAKGYEFLGFDTDRWNLHDLWSELTLPGGALFSKKWTTKIARRLARAEQTMRVRIARDDLRRLRELTVAVDALEAEIADLVAQVAPHLLIEPGFGPLTAAKLIRRDRQRFSSEAKLARAAGVAPIPVSSGKTKRHRLDRGGNRQINAALHRIAVTRARCHPETQTYLDRKRKKARAPARPSAASSATSPAASGTCSSRPGRQRSLPISLDIGGRREAHRSQGVRPPRQGRGDRRGDRQRRGPQGAHRRRRRGRGASLVAATARHAMRRGPA